MPLWHVGKHYMKEWIGDKMTRPIYADYQATTPTDPQVVEAMLPYFTEKCGNPHSREHLYGWEAEAAIDIAREQIADVIQAAPHDIIFTSGATESNNMIIKGVAEKFHESHNHIITVATEHKCVIEACRIAERYGVKTTFLPVDHNGHINIEQLEAAIQPNTILISVMAANNEIGTIMPLMEIGALCLRHNILFHTDAAQAFGKITLDVNSMHIDAMSISGHKCYGPKGIGALYIRKQSPKKRFPFLYPLIDGGGQQQGMRAGTLPTPLAVGLGKAALLAHTQQEKENTQLYALTEQFYHAIKKVHPDIMLNGPELNRNERLAGNVNICFPGIRSEQLIVSMKGLAASSSSACTSSSLLPSYVLKAIGLSDAEAQSSIRFSFGRFSTAEDVNRASQIVIDSVKTLRGTTS